MMLTKRKMAALGVMLLGLAWQPVCGAQQPASADSRLQLLPWPKVVRVDPGEVRLGDDSRILVNSPKLQPLAEILRAELRLVVGLDLATTTGTPQRGDIVLSIDPQLRAGEEILGLRNQQLTRTREEAYRLEAREFISIAGCDQRAVAAGTATLLQAVTRTDQGTVIPRLSIHDWPHADFTGVMLDVARQSNTVADIRRCIETCRLYKVRYLQLHLTDDQAWTFPSSAYPTLGTRNGSAHGGPRPERFDLAELASLVQYADARGVTLVPELECPGHSANACGTLPALFGYIDPETGNSVGQGMMNIANPKLYEALDILIGEMCDVFASSPYVHIGFDEVSGLANVAGTPAALAFMKEHQLQDAGELMAHFARQVNAMVRKRGKTTIIWEGPANGVSPDIIHMAWDGNARTAERLVAQGFSTITVPWNLAGVPWHDWTMYHCNGSVLTPGDPVLGAMLPIWEQPGDVSFRWLRGGIARRQERTWGPGTPIEPTNFARRAAATAQVLERLIYGFAIEQSPPGDEGLTHREITVPTTLSLKAWPTLGEVRYTLDRPGPMADEHRHIDPIRVADNLTVTAWLADSTGQPLSEAWVQPYRFAPLTLKPEGLLPQSFWFRETMRLVIASTLQTGTVRYTLDGSTPVPTSPASTQPLVLDASAMVRARWFDADNQGRGNVASATYRKLVSVQHAAVNQPTKIIVTARLEDLPAAAKLLVDGVLGREGDWGSPEVLRLGDSDLEAVIDLGQSLPIHKVVGRFYHHQEAGIYPACRFEVSVSEDGRTFRPAGTTRHTVPQERGPTGVFVRELVVEPGMEGRFIKVFCKNNGLLPAWHQAPGVLGHLMLDEILVNPAPQASPDRR